MNAEKNQYDVAVIGAGTAGLVSAFLADSLSARVALVERNRVGGECLWTGCVPSKALLKAARVYDMAKRAEEFGIHVENVRVRWNAVQLRIAAVRDEIKQLERDELARTNIEIIKGVARFQDASTLSVTNGSSERLIRAQKFVLACGMKPRVPQIEGLVDVGFVTNENVFEMKSLPRSWVILGGGPVGVEMAQAFRRLDCRVTLLQSASTLLPREDSEISAEARKILEQDGVKVITDVEVIRARTDEDKKRVEFLEGGKKHQASASEILVAVGKEAQFDELNLETTGTMWSEDGVACDEYLRCAPKVWACGDMTGEYLFTHVAEAQAKIAAQNALLPIKRKWDARVVPWTTFTDPEIARVGLSEGEAQKEYGKTKIYRQEFSKLDRAIIEGEARGFLKIVTSGSGRVLGAHIIGPSAGELIHSFVIAVRDGMLLQEFAETIHVYPTLSEIGHRAGNEYYRGLLDNRLLKDAVQRMVRRSLR